MKIIAVIAFTLMVGTAQASVVVRADVVSNYDGDTITVDAYIWPNQTWHGSVRVRGVDTPEIQGECESEKALAIEARDFVADLIGQEVLLEYVTDDKYGGRVIATVTLTDGRDLADVLISEGLGRPYDGGTRESWC